MNKQIQEFTDIELTKAMQQEYETLIRCQNNLQMINAEIKRREELESKKTNDKDAGQSSKQDSPEKK